MTYTSFFLLLSDLSDIVFVSPHYDPEHQHFLILLNVTMTSEKVCTKCKHFMSFSGFPWGADFPSPNLPYCQHTRCDASSSFEDFIGVYVKLVESSTVICGFIGYAVGTTMSIHSNHYHRHAYHCRRTLGSIHGYWYDIQIFWSLK